jgi:hypothetical protein
VVKVIASQTQISCFSIIVSDLFTKVGGVDEMFVQSYFFLSNKELIQLFF